MLANLENSKAYIGETDHWCERVTCHYKQTLRHKAPEPDCKGCGEHVKYLKHSGVDAHGWIMFPLATCENKHDSQLLERLLIRHISPSLNAYDRKYVIGNNYLQ